MNSKNNNYISLFKKFIITTYNNINNEKKDYNNCKYREQRH